LYFVKFQEKDNLKGELVEKEKEIRKYKTTIYDLNEKVKQLEEKLKTATVSFKSRNLPLVRFLHKDTNMSAFQSKFYSQVRFFIFYETILSISGGSGPGIWGRGPVKKGGAKRSSLA